MKKYLLLMYCLYYSFAVQAQKDDCGTRTPATSLVLKPAWQRQQHLQYTSPLLNIRLISPNFGIALSQLLSQFGSVT